MRLRMILATALLFSMLSPTLGVAKTKKKTAKSNPAPKTATAPPASEVPSQAISSPEPEPQPLPSQSMPEEPIKGAYNEAEVVKLEGTIMVQHANRVKATAIQTGSTIEKGDVLSVYDGAWVILKTHRGDRIGLASSTVVGVDEYFIKGPDRQIRLVLQKGTLLLKTNNSSSRQSFFEVQAGAQVVSVGESKTILNYEPTDSRLKVQYFQGQLSVIDKENEEKFATEHSEYNWENGKKTDSDPLLLDESVAVNYKRFFDGMPPLETPNSNLILPARDVRKHLPSKP